MRIRITIACIVSLSVVACSPFRGNLVGRAGDHELEVDEFAQILANGKVQLDPALVERWAWTWVQYSLYAQRLAVGDSFTDTASVRQAMWPDVMASVTSRFAERSLRLDSATVDSVYLAGDQRVIDQILVRVAPGTTPEQKSALRRRTRQIHRSLLRGTAWLDAIRESSDIAAFRIAGRLPVVERGQFVPEVERVVFSLPPGGLSPVTESSFGFHILRRPELSEIRIEYGPLILNQVFERWKTDRRAELLESRGVKLVKDAASIVRRASKEPITILALEQREVIADYDGGKFTNIDFIHWLQALPVEDHIVADSAGDAQLTELVKRVLGNDLIFADAISKGVHLPDSDFADIEQGYNERLTQLRRAMRIDTLLARARDVQERRRVAKEAADGYLLRIVNTLRDVHIVPPFLAQRLRDEGNWMFSYDGLNRAVDRAVRLRARKNER